jgi:SHS2 domain-containing protein
VHGFDEHVGELQLWITAATAEDLFVEAVRAVAEILDEGRPGAREVEERQIALQADDRAVLLADWIGELAFLAETDAFVPDAVATLELRDGGLRARVRGHPGRPPHLVKAVTYHDLRFEPDGDGWRAQVVLDV